MPERNSPSRPAVAPVKVLAIIGMTRSGSTILDNILGELDGFFSTGELHYLWQRGVMDRRRCGCGATVVACPVWSRILAQVSNEGERAAPAEVVDWQQRTVRARHTWKLMRRTRAEAGGPPSLGAYENVLAHLYRAVADVTGTRVVIDSSKRASDAAVLGLLPGVEPYFVHLVRDPRAVAYSWRRAKRELDHDGRAEMPRRSTISSATTWLELNLAAEAVRHGYARDRSLLIRYEDFVERPAATVRRIAALVGEAPTQLPIDDEGTARLGVNHSVAGNPSRFRRGAVGLHSDDEWQRAQSLFDKTLTTGMTLPMLARYGYWI
ncbi:MAG: sulfotransferase [Actinomycetota bacterium]